MSTSECLSLLRAIIITDNDYERIKYQYPEAINPQETYRQLVARNMKILLDLLILRLIC